MRCRIRRIAVTIIFAMLFVAMGTSVQAAARNKLVQKDGKYYYYDENGLKLKNAWKTIGDKKYYFTKNGAAAVGCAKIEKTNYLFNAKGVLQRPSSGTYIKIKKAKYYKVELKGKVYYVKSNGKSLMPGAYCRDNKMKFLCIGSNGAYDEAMTKKLNGLSKQEALFSKLSAQLTKLGIKQVRKTAVAGCYSMNGKKGQEWFLDYKNFSVLIFKCTNGSSYVLGIYDALTYDQVLEYM
ncbi:MAG: hypothetical protein HUJ72_01795 [Blautia sp.]|nr:hypothetical protein [Blautia sp.]